MGYPFYGKDWAFSSFDAGISLSFDTPLIFILAHAGVAVVVATPVEDSPPNSNFR